MNVSQSRLATEANAAASVPPGTPKRYVGERFGSVKPAAQRGALFCTTLFLMGALQGAAHAVDHTWAAGNDNFNVAANWNPATVPTATDNATVDNGAEVSITGNQATAELRAGTANGSGTYTQSGVGTTLTTTAFLQGLAAGATGTFNLNEGTVNTASAGNANIFLGEVAGGTGNLNINGGTFNIVATGSVVRFGLGGTANVIISGGLLDNRATVTSNMGTNAGSVGNMTISGTELIPGAYTGARTLNVGLNGTGNLFLQPGGTFTNSDFILGSGATGVGNMDMTGGTFTGRSVFYIGFQGAGTMNMSGGTFSNANIAFMGATTGSSGVANISGGTMNFNAISGGSLRVGGNPNTNTAAIATSTVNQTGGSVKTANELWIGRGVGSTGVYNLSGGDVNSVNFIAIGLNSTAYNTSGTLNLSGTGVITRTGANTTSATTLIKNATVNQSAGTFNSPSNPLWIGEAPTGSSTYQMSGGTANFGSVIVARIAGGSGTLLLQNASDGPTGTLPNGGGTQTFTTTTLTLGNTGAGSTATVQLNGGTLKANQVVGATGGTKIFNFNGGTLQAGATNASFLSGMTTADVQAGGARIDTNSFDVAVPQVLSGTGALTKLGAGTLTFSGANTYTGATTVNAGTLLVNNTTGSGTGAGAVTVNSGATLAGNGTISGAATLAVGATHAPGVAGPGIESTGNYGNSGVLLADLNGAAAGTGYDQVNVTGAVDVTGATLSLSSSGYTATVGDALILINNDGADAVTGTFAGLIEGASVNAGGNNFTISYTGGDGNDVVLTAQAPPASGATGFAVSGSDLYSFNTATPGTQTLVGAISGGIAPEGIDFNPANGLLYALDIGATTTQLYTLDTATAVATAVGSGFANSGLAGANSYDLTGQAIGFDFNPKTLQNDGSIRIRVTAQNGSDIRLNSSTGTVSNIDGTLRVGAGGPVTSIVGSAYNNNIAQQAGGGATALYGVSDTNDALYLQSPPNDGVLAIVGAGLGIDVKGASGFDILTSGTNTAYLATDAITGGGSEFFVVDLAAGTATAAGNFGTLAVDDIAIQPAAAADRVPVVQSITRQSGTANPTTSTSVPFTVTFSEAVSGVDAGDFSLTTTGSLSGATITSVTPVAGPSATYTVVVGSFSGTGTIRLNVVDDDSITDVTTPLGGAGGANGNFAVGEVINITASASSGAIISEFRFRGTASSDEYVELYNTTGAPLNISDWKISTSTGGAITQDTLVPANTIVPAYGHFLFTGAGYGLTTYGASDAAIGADAANDSGVALFNSAGAVQDAAGFNTSLTTLREGAGLASAPSGSSQSAFMRRFKGQTPVDSGDNAADFLLLTTDGAAVAGTSIAPQLGAPNPEGLNSPNNINAQIGVRVLDANFGPNAAPNRVRNGSGNGGSLVFRRIIKNNTGKPLNRIRLLITDITGQVSPVVAGQADVRVTSQANENVAVAGQGTVLVYGTTLEAPSNLPSGTGLSTVGGGGIGSSVSYDIVLTTPLAAGDERPYTFNVQVAKTGSFFVNINLLGK